MTSRDSITAWIDGVRDGDSKAAEMLWSAYFDKLVGVARKKMDGARVAARDEEDVALSAFKSFCLAARSGRLKELIDRDSLWPLLVAMTANKSVDAIRHENRKKRGGTGKASDDSSAYAAKRIDVSLSAADFLSQTPSPEFAAQLTEQFELLLDSLDQTGDSNLRRVAIMKFEGASTSEIAKEMDCARRTVERKLNIVRRLINEQLDDASDE